MFNEFAGRVGDYDLGGCDDDEEDDDDQAEEVPKEAEKVCHKNLLNNLNSFPFFAIFRP